MTKHIQRQIEVLKQKILYVGTLVEEAIAKAISALVNRDAVLARKVIEADNEIDRMEVDVEEECLKMLALYQPVAADLRFVVAVLKINNDLERMGDLAQNIAKRVVYSGQGRSDGVADRFPQHGHQGADDGQAKPGCAGELRHRRWPRRCAPRTTKSTRLGSAFAKQIMEAIRKHPDRVEYLLKLNSVSQASGAAGRHGHERRRRRDLHGRRRNRPPPARGRVSRLRLSGKSRVSHFRIRSTISRRIQHLRRHARCYPPQCCRRLAPI